MPILGDNTISKSTQLHRTFEGRTDWASQTELNNREAELDAMREQEDVVDICDRCGEEFGLSGEDGNGYNCTCVHCGNNTYHQESAGQP